MLDVEGRLLDVPFSNSPHLSQPYDTTCLNSGLGNRRFTVTA